MSDTPRTDAWEIALIFPTGGSYADAYFQCLKYARELERDIAAARADAERYRWLRDKSPSHRVPAPSATLQDGHGIKIIYQVYGVDDRVKPRIVLFEDALDKAVDDAISALPERKS